MTDGHDHARPGPADMRAALATARAILTDADPAVQHQAAASGTCPACTAMAGISFGFSLTATLAGEQLGVSRQLVAAMLAAVEAAQRDMRTAGN